MVRRLGGQGHSHPGALSLVVGAQHIYVLLGPHEVCLWVDTKYFTFPNLPLEDDFVVPLYFSDNKSN